MNFMLTFHSVLVIGTLILRADALIIRQIESKHTSHASEFNASEAPNATHLGHAVLNGSSRAEIISRKLRVLRQQQRLMAVARKTHSIPSSSSGLERVTRHQQRDSNKGYKLALNQHRVPNGDLVLLRPGAGGSADIVEFGLIAKNFFGAQLKHNRFTIDVVLSLEWIDERVHKIIPHGLNQLTMAWSQAIELMWMPGIVVANKDIEMYEIISASVTIFRSGRVMRVERAQARCLKKYELQQYPFDEQNLDVEIVSSKYMLDDMVLVPSKSDSGVMEGVWGLYELKGWNVTEYEDYDGDLRKSRGLFRVSLKRTLEKYFDDHLVPCAIVLTISWAVFWFPFGTNAFITPRMALSILALLTFTNLMVKSSKELPGAAPFNWNDLFNQQIQAMMFVTIVFNISSEIAFHQFQMERFAREMNNEAKILIPLTSLINISVVLSAGMYGWMSLETASIITKVFVAIFLIAYGVYVGRTISIEDPKILESFLVIAPAAEAVGGDADDGGCGGD